MSVHAKKLPTEGCIEVLIGQRKPRLFLVPKETAQGIAQVLKEYEVQKSEDSVPASDLFPDLADDRKRPAAVLRGARHKEGLTQSELSLKLKITQSDLSKMETGARPIGKKMARRLSQVLKIDYRVFL